jgi:succinate dehydrogenase/fumarate reductase flavoprotein subunit
MDRRNLLRGAALGSGALAMAGLAVRPVVAQGLPRQWTQEADVVIVGYGLAGASAAIAAHDVGAKVLMLEKAPEKYKGGNSKVAGNGVFWPDDIEKAKIYFRAMTGAYMDGISDEMLDVWANEMHANRAWLEKMGWKPFQYGAAEFPDLPGADCVHRFLHGEGPMGQARLWDGVIEPALQARKIPALYETRAVNLVKHNNDVVGVVAEQGGKQIHIRASRAVILTTGGFEANERMVRDYVNDMPHAATMGTPYNTGDGIHIAMAAGADLWHMNNVSGPVPLFKAPDQPVPTIIRVAAPNFIFVGRDGTRFVAEGDPLGMASHGKVHVNGRWLQMPCPLPVFMVFDETFRKAGGIGGQQTGWHMGWDATYNLYDWSADNSREIEKGWIKRANTLRDLAAAVNLPPDGLDATVQRFNGYAEAHADPEFGRAPGSLGALQTPPFYAMELTPSFINTQGGPRRNKDAQIVDVAGNPIPRLYSSGELGSIYGFQYNGGGNLGECVAFGRIAGQNAAKQKPWVLARTNETP